MSGFNAPFWSLSIPIREGGEASLPAQTESFKAAVMEIVRHHMVEVTGAPPEEINFGSWVHQSNRYEPGQLVLGTDGRLVHLVNHTESASPECLPADREDPECRHR